MDTKIVEMYTDGSCNYKTKDGGIGIYMKYNGHEKRISEGYRNTTNNRMELLAATKAMELTPSSYSIIIHSDSQYVINAITKQWLLVWERHNFLGTKNLDLWKRFLEAYRRFGKGSVQFQWVKGHAGIEGNEIADKLAREGYRNPTYNDDGKLGTEVAKEDI